MVLNGIKSYKKIFGRVLNCRWFLPVQHSLQGHPKSSKIWMRMIDRVLIEKMGFLSTTHDRCVYHKQVDDELILMMRQVDDFMIACTDENMAKNIANIIATKICFQTEKYCGEVPIEFLGMVDDYIGVDINQTGCFVKMSAKRYIGQFLASCGWSKTSEEEQSYEMKSKRPISPLPSDCMKQLFNDVGPCENTVEFHLLERNSGFSYQTVLGLCLNSLPHHLLLIIQC